MQFNVGDEVTLINGVKAHIIDVVQEPISQNLVYVVDQPFVGDQDDVFEYNRQYYGDNTFYVYPSEIEGKTEGEMKEEIDNFSIDIDSSKLTAVDLIKHEINESPIKNTKLPDDIIYSEAAQEKFIDGVRAVVREMSNDEELIQNTPRRLLKAFDEWFKESNVPLEQIAKETCKTFESENTDLIIADNIEVFATCCFEYRSQVLTPNGYKRIGDIKAGDIVSTYNKEKDVIEDKKVIKTFKNPAHDMMEIRFQDRVKSVKVTANHPFFNEHGDLVNAMDLKPGDKVYGLRQFYKNHKNTTHLDKLEYNYSLGYVLGALMSDGTFWRNTIRLSVTDEEFADNFSRNLKECCGLETSDHIYYHKGGFKENKIKMYSRRVTCSQLYSIFQEMMQDKKNGLPKVIFNDYDIFKGFIQGYHDGDGNHSNDSMRIFTSDYSFATNLSNVLKTSLYENGATSQTGTYMYTVTIPKHLVTNKDSKYSKDFKEYFNNELKNAESYKVSLDMRLLEVTDIQRKDNSKGYVYNLEVEDNPTYIVNGIWVHNCHHCCPYSTTIAIGVIPDGKVMGLSKYSRVAKRVARRFDSGMVENLVTNIYKVLKIGLGTDNIMVVAYSKPGQVHTCAASRGANDTNMQVTSSSIHGLFVANPELKREFLSLIRK